MKDRGKFITFCFFLFYFVYKECIDQVHTKIMQKYKLCYCFYIYHEYVLLRLVIDIYFSCLVVISLLDLILIINFVYYKISKFKYRLLVFRQPFKMNENTTNEVNQSFHPNKQFFIELGN